MANNSISYLNRTFDDYKEALRDYVLRYYPQIADDFNDASIGSWLVDLVATVADNLSYYIDKSYAETNLDTAAQASSIYNIARSNGLKVPGPKGAMAEVEFSCVVPSYNPNNPNSSSGLGAPSKDFLPIIKKGTKVTSRNQVFEVMEDINFAEQFDSPRTVIPYNGKYKIIKKGVVTAGESKIYKQTIFADDIVPFMEIILPDTNVMNIESIIFKDGSDFKSDPNISEFMGVGENYKTVDNKDVYRFFEVNSLAEQYRWDADVKQAGNQSAAQPSSCTYGFFDNVTGKYVPSTTITRGKWYPVTQKFITEFTDKGYLKIIFGSGEQVGQEESVYEENSDFAKYQISKMVRNNFLGRLPKAGWTMYVLYRTGGGAASNVAAGAINNISYLNVEIGNSSYLCSAEDRQKAADVRNSITVTNPNPSVSGKDAPTVEEIKAMIKYNNAAQERCVTVKDYENRILQMDPKYGSPYRISAIEENNKVKIFMLGLNHNGKLSALLPQVLISNIVNYLSKYKSINDYVAIEAGEIVHLSFDVEIFIDKNYNGGDVAYNVIETIKNYMDISKHQLGEDIFVGDIERAISSVDGVLNLINLTVYNMFHDGTVNSDYSESRIAQTTESVGGEAGRAKVLLEETNYVLNSNVDSMFEINHPETDIRVKMIAR